MAWRIGGSPEVRFNRGKPFYVHVVNYIAQAHGFVDLASRGLANLYTTMGEAEREAAFADPVYGATARRIFEGRLTEQLARLAIEAKAQTPPIVLDLGLLGEELVDHHDEILEGIMGHAGALFMLAWETSESFHNPGPLWEFLRHCRNAAAHGGRFNFVRAEPRRPAQWRTFTITAALQATPLFESRGSAGLLKPADGLLLLFDIEQTIP